MLCEVTQCDRVASVCNKSKLTFKIENNNKYRHRYHDVFRIFQS